jgi:hypothetical protein
MIKDQPGQLRMDARCRMRQSHTANEIVGYFLSLYGCKYVYRSLARTGVLECMQPRKRPLSRELV